MCGITGFITKQSISINQFRAMNDLMYHRGPDDFGAEIDMVQENTDFKIGLAQRRLSIIDLRPLGHQPMHSADKGVSIVFNGEIYNFRELRKELERGYVFRSNTDTEVIIAAYLKWGISCVDRLNGMFAIALYDRNTSKLYLVRDRIGKKPLYYELEGENIYFASELKPLMARPGFKKNINKGVISRYLYQHYINAPETIFENVSQLEPGTVLEYHLGEVRTWKYWDISSEYDKNSAQPVKDYDEAKAGLKERLLKATESRMISDVPLGTFLSGGYDSSLVTALAQEISSTPVKTFCIGFNDEKYNEAKYASLVASHLGTDHTELYIDERDLFRLVDDIPKYYDEPFADSSQIATMMVSSLAKNEVTVALSGDGGDEFFCGYNLYDKIAKARKLDALGGMVHSVTNLPGIRKLDAESRLPFKVRVIAENRNLETKTQLGSPHYVEVAKRMVLGEGESCFYEFESKYSASDWQERRMLLDMETYLPGDILVKVDRASMRYSLETRCPILDKNVSEYSFRIPHEFKYRDGIKKYILKDIAYDYIPKELLDRPKTGFGVPLDKWLRGPLKRSLLRMAETDRLSKQGIFVPGYTHEMIKRYLETGDKGASTGENFSRLVWSFFVFQQWYERYIDAL